MLADCAETFAARASSPADAARPSSNAANMAAREASAISAATDATGNFSFIPPQNSAARAADISFLIEIFPAIDRRMFLRILCETAEGAVGCLHLRGIL